MPAYLRLRDSRLRRRIAPADRDPEPLLPRTLRRRIPRSERQVNEDAQAIYSVRWGFLRRRIPKAERQGLTAPDDWVLRYPLGTQSQSDALDRSAQRTLVTFKKPTITPVGICGHPLVFIEGLDPGPDVIVPPLRGVVKPGAWVCPDDGPFVEAKVQ